MNARSAAIAALLAIASLAAACTRQVGLSGNVFRNGQVAFTVPPIPERWRRLELSDADLAFRDDTGAASILINSRCHRKDDDVPLPVLVDHLIMGTTDRNFVDESTIPMDGREARHAVLLAKLDGVLRQFDIFVLKKNGCIFDFVYVAEPQTFAEGAPAFDQFVHGVHVLDTPGEP